MDKGRRRKYANVRWYWKVHRDQKNPNQQMSSAVVVSSNTDFLHDTPAHCGAGLPFAQFGNMRRTPVVPARIQLF